MKNWKRLFALILSGAMILSLYACGSGDSTESPSADLSGEVSVDPDATSTPGVEADLSQSALEFAAGLSPTDILLTVNGDEVQADLFCYLLGQYCTQTEQYFSYFGMSLADMPDMSADLLEQAVQMSAYHNIVRQKAAELGCLLTDDQAADVKEALEDPELENSAAFWDLTGPSLRFIFELNPYYDNLLNAVTHDPDEQELMEYIDSEGLYRVKHILLKTVDDNQQALPEDEAAEKRAKAEDLLAQLQAAADLPAKFDELMMAHSEDHPENNPDGYTATPGQMVAAFEEASLALKEGEISGIVESEYGYHIILRLPLDLTDEMKESYRSDFRRDALEGQMDQWVEAADIVRADALSDLDAVDFYVRLAAYQQALAEQQAEEDGVG